MKNLMIMMALCSTALVHSQPRPALQSAHVQIIDVYRPPATQRSPEYGDFIQYDLERLQSSLAMQRAANLMLQPHVLSVSPIVIDNIIPYLSLGVLSFEHPVDGRGLSFVTDRVVELSPVSYVWHGYSATNGDAVSITKNPYGYGGYLALYSTGEYYQITALDSLQHYLVKVDILAITDEAPCVTSHHEPLDEIYDSTYVVQRCGEDNVRILFLSTPGVGAISNPRQVAFDVLEELNMATDQSNIDHRYVLAGVEELFGFVQDDGVENDVDDPLHDLEEVFQSNLYHFWRDQHNADLTVVLVENPYPQIDPVTGLFLGNVLGIARAIPAKKATAYCLVSVAAATMGFTATHEIGHLLGGRHQRCDLCPTGGCDDQTRYHGFEIVAGAGDFSTIMRQNACGDPRVGRFSDRDAQFLGADTGDNRNRNSDIIERCSNRASCFELGGAALPGAVNEVPVRISGPVFIGDCGTPETWNVTTGPGLLPPMTFRWEISTTGFAPWTIIGNTQAITIANPGALPDWFVLRVVVTDGFGSRGIDETTVTTVPCLDDGDDDEVQIRSDDNNNNDRIVEEIRCFDIRGMFIS